MKKKVLIFDFDGVILNSNKIKDEAFLSLYKKYGKKFSNYVLNHHKKNRGISRFKKFENYHKKLFGKNIKQKEMDDLNQNMKKIIINKMNKVRFIYGVKNFISKFYKKFDLFIISSSPENELIEICKKRKISTYFIQILGSPNDKFKNLNKIINNFNYKKKQILYLGDSFSDYVFAKKSNIEFIGVRNESFKSEVEISMTINHFVNFSEILKKYYDK